MSSIDGVGRWEERPEGVIDPRALLATGFEAASARTRRWPRHRQARPGSFREGAGPAATAGQHGAHEPAQAEEPDAAGKGSRKVLGALRPSSIQRPPAIGERRQQVGNQVDAS